MTVEELLEFHKKFFDEAFALCHKKNHDYAQGSTGCPFLNFTRAESMGITSTEKGFLVRMVDKMSRLSTYCDRGELKVSNETVRDALLDIVNYSILLGAYIHDKESKDKGQA